MTQTSWQQFKHNWITFAVTAMFAIIGYTANKIDRFMDDYSRLSKTVMINGIIDSIQSSNIIQNQIEIKQFRNELADFKHEFNAYINELPELNAVIRKQDYTPKN